MAYATKYYDYQVAIIFLILLAGMCLLALVVGAIYFICVVNMRNKKGGITRVPSGRSTVRTRMEWAPQQQQPQYQPEQQYGAGQEGYGQQPQQYSYQPPPATTQQQQQYEQAVAGARVRELQPEYFQQQGPITYTTMYTYEPQQQQQAFQQQPATAGTSYHMSSV